MWVVPDDVADGQKPGGRRGGCPQAHIRGAASRRCLVRRITTALGTVKRCLHMRDCVRCVWYPGHQWYVMDSQAEQHREEQCNRMSYFASLARYCWLCSHGVANAPAFKLFPNRAFRPWRSCGKNHSRLSR